MRSEKEIREMISRLREAIKRAKESGNDVLYANLRRIYGYYIRALEWVLGERETLLLSEDALALLESAY